MEKEIWKDIPGYEDYYQVINLGRVRSLDRIILDKNGVSCKIKGRLLKFYCGKYDKRPSIDLNKDGIRYKTRVCRLVLSAFIGTCPEGM